MKITKRQIRRIIKEALEDLSGQYEEVPRTTWKNELQGRMDPLSKEELQSMFPNERIADPQRPGSMGNDDLMPLGRQGGFVYFKTKYGPILKSVANDTSYGF